MQKEVYLGFDFGYKRIGVAVGQTITHSANPLKTLSAKQGIPNWQQIANLIHHWKPKAIIVGVPTMMDGTAQYTTHAVHRFSKQLKERFSLPVHLVDERLTTIEARARLFEQGGYKTIAQSPIDSFAACLILEQWLQAL